MVPCNMRSSPGPSFFGLAMPALTTCSNNHLSPGTRLAVKALPAADNGRHCHRALSESPRRNTLRGAAADAADGACGVASSDDSDDGHLCICDQL